MGFRGVGLGFVRVYGLRVAVEGLWVKGLNNSI